MFATNKECVLSTVSQSTGQTVYWDGRGWTLLRANAAVYQNFDFTDEDRECLEQTQTDEEVLVEYA